jgi:hypothetical protein
LHLDGTETWYLDNLDAEWTSQLSLDSL